MGRYSGEDTRLPRVGGDHTGAMARPVEPFVAIDGKLGPVPVDDSARPGAHPQRGGTRLAGHDGSDAVRTDDHGRVGGERAAGPIAAADADELTCPITKQPGDADAVPYLRTGRTSRVHQHAVEHSTPRGVQ